MASNNKRSSSSSDHSSAPLVSCLMVTRPERKRFPYFKQSVRAYCKQTHEPKELVIVVDRSEKDAQKLYRDYIKKLKRKDIRWISPSEEKVCLGELRNRSVAEAKGPFVCMWDDDDLSHPRRVEIQLHALKLNQVEAIVLKDNFQLFWPSREIFWLNWPGEEGCLPGTVLCSKSAAIACGYNPQAIESEDSDFITLMRKRFSVERLGDMPFLYIYTFHGNNVWAREHRINLNRYCSLTKEELRARKRIAVAELGKLGLGRKKIRFVGKDGFAFSWSPGAGTARKG